MRKNKHNYNSGAIYNVIVETVIRTSALALLKVNCSEDLAY